MKAPALVALTEAGAQTARRLLRLWPEAELHGRQGRVAEAHAHFRNAKELLPALFCRAQPLIAFCAAGIVVRALAGVLGDKNTEPPVLAVSEDGSHIVPLLGAHRGALSMAQQAADCLGGTVAATGAGENRFGVLLDAPPAGWRLSNPQDFPAFMAALLQHESVSLHCEDGTNRPNWLTNGRLPWREHAPLAIHIGTSEAEGSAQRLVYHPQSLLLGMGCERGAEAAEVEALALQTLGQHGLARKAVAALVSLDLKADEPALLQLAERWHLPFRFFPAGRLEQETPRLPNPSEAVFREVGCHGVAEAAALAAAGPEAKLLAAKTKSARATCAIARAAAPVNAAHIGRGRGSLAIVGLGPGEAVWRCLEADLALSAADDIIGYRFYLGFLGPLAAGKRLHGFALGEETARARKALQLAAEGRHVALVSSGDAGIYGMASPLLEEMEKTGASGFCLRVVPGISALQLAAARAGAPLGHDFAAISLSDLLTPWQQIETRLQTALQADFAIALYNPTSRRRSHRLQRALQLMREHRSDKTPVVVARDLGRVGEQTRILPLAEVNAEDIDMTTILLVGSSQTRRWREWACTPRGYGGKP